MNSDLQTVPSASRPATVPSAIRPATRNLLQNLYTAGRNFVEDWEGWALRHVPPMTAAKVLHEFLIRFAKGMLKALRIYLNEA